MRNFDEKVIEKDKAIKKWFLKYFLKKRPKKVTFYMLVNI